MTKLLMPLSDAATDPVKPDAVEVASPETRSSSGSVATTEAYVGQFGRKRRIPVMVDLRTRSVWPVAKPKT